MPCRARARATTAHTRRAYMATPLHAKRLACNSICMQANVPLGVSPLGFRRSAFAARLLHYASTISSIPTHPPPLLPRAQIIRVSVETYGMRWRKIAARLPGRSDDAVRNRWNRVNEEPTLLAGLRGGAKALLDGASFLSDDAMAGGGALVDAADGAGGEGVPSGKKRSRDGVRVVKASRPPAATDDATTSLELAPGAYGVYSRSGPASPTHGTPSPAAMSPGGASESALSHATVVAHDTTAAGEAGATCAPPPLTAAPVATAVVGAAPAKPRARSGGSKRRDRAAAEAAGVPMRAIWSQAEDFVILRYVKVRASAPASVPPPLPPLPSIRTPWRVLAPSPPLWSSLSSREWAPSHRGVRLRVAGAWA